MRLLSAVWSRCLHATYSLWSRKTTVSSWHLLVSVFILLFSIQEKVLYLHTSVSLLYFEAWSIKLILKICLKKKRKKGTLEHKVVVLFYFNSTAWQTYGPALRFCRMVNAFIQEIKPTFSVYSNPILLPPRILAVGHFSTDWNLNCADE